MRKYLDTQLGSTLNFFKKTVKAVFRNLIYDEEFLRSKGFYTLRKARSCYLSSRRYF